MTVRSIFPARAWLMAAGAFLLLGLAGCQDSYSPTEPSLDEPSLDLVTTTLSTATGVEVQITTNEDRQGSPAISGDRIVWADYRNGNSDIYMYDLSTSPGTLTQITDNALDQFAADISGDRIVWFDRRYGYPDDIYMYDLVKGEETLIWDAGNIKAYDLSISGDWIMWREWDQTSGTRKISAYDLSAAEPAPIQLSADEASPQYPAISGDRVVWVQVQANDTNGYDYDIYLYDLSAEPATQPIQITNDGVMKTYTNIWGDRIVWWEPGDNWYGELFLYDLSEPSTGPTRITGPDARPLQRAPAIWGDWIVWVDSRNDLTEESGNTDIYMHDLSTGTETQVTTDESAQSSPDVSGDRIVWEDYRNGTDNVDIYMYDASVPSLSPDAMLEALITVAKATDGVSKGTVNKLYDALDHWESGRTTAAVSNLEAFINDLQSHKGKKVSDEDAATLIAAAQEIIDTILAAGS